MFTRYLAIGVDVLAGLFTAYAVFYAFTTPAQRAYLQDICSPAWVRCPPVRPPEPLRGRVRRRDRP